MEHGKTQNASGGSLNDDTAQDFQGGAGKCAALNSVAKPSTIFQNAEGIWFPFEQKPTRA
jgi:hypothetical protein